MQELDEFVRSNMVIEKKISENVSNIYKYDSLYISQEHCSQCFAILKTFLPGSESAVAIFSVCR